MSKIFGFDDFPYRPLNKNFNPIQLYLSFDKHVKNKLKTKNHDNFQRILSDRNLIEQEDYYNNIQFDIMNFNDFTINDYHNNNDPIGEISNSSSDEDENFTKINKFEDKRLTKPANSSISKSPTNFKRETRSQTKKISEDNSLSEKIIKMKECKEKLALEREKKLQAEKEKRAEEKRRREEAMARKRDKELNGKLKEIGVSVTLINPKKRLSPREDIILNKLKPKQPRVDPNVNVPSIKSLIAMTRNIHSSPEGSKDSPNADKFEILPPPSPLKSILSSNSNQSNSEESNEEEENYNYEVIKTKNPLVLKFRRASKPIDSTIV